MERAKRTQKQFIERRSTVTAALSNHTRLVPFFFPSHFSFVLLYFFPFFLFFFTSERRARKTLSYYKITAGNRKNHWESYISLLREMHDTSWCYPITDPFFFLSYFYILFSLFVKCNKTHSADTMYVVGKNNNGDTTNWLVAEHCILW